MNPSPNFPHLKTALATQEELSPPPAVKARLMAKIHKPAQPQLKPALQWAMGAATALLAVLVLWAAVQPGTVLAWQSAPAVDAFRVYRAPEGSQDFELLREIEADQKIERYTFLDPLLIPGRSYQYRIEGWQAEGQLAFQQTISGKTLAALPAQLAILFSSLILGFGALSLTKPNNFRDTLTLSTP